MAVFDEFENQILDMIDNRDEFTRSDLQGVVGALVCNIYQSGRDFDGMSFTEILEAHKNNATKHNLY